MVSLRSVSNPARGSALEGARPVRPLLAVAGGAGAEPPGDSLSARYLLVKGKSEAPMARRFGPRARGGLETVIGVDDRQRILETTMAPWRMICALRMTAEGGGAAIGTGWLVGPRTVMTAGHCVHSTEFFGGWASEIEVSPGRNGQVELPFGTLVSRRFSSVDRWVGDEDPDYDVGCIHLSEPIGDRIGWFGLACIPSDGLEQYLVNISGYPADRGWGTEQYFHANRVIRVTDRRLFYDVDTYGGQSGAPVWVYRDGDPLPQVVGIHAYGIGGTPVSFAITANSAPRIIPEVFEQIKAWVQADEGQG